MISYRGILALAIGAVFLWFAFQPEAFGEDAPPLFISAILVFGGAGLVAMGVVSMRFVYRRHRLRQQVAPIPGEVVITVDDSSDSTTYTLEVRLDDGAWAIGAAACKALTRRSSGVPHPAQVWRDPNTGAPFAIAIGGQQVNTLPFARRAPHPAN